MPDITPPTVSLRTSVTHFATVGFTGYSNAVYITLSEPSTDFNSSDLTVVGGMLWNFSGSGTEYKAYVSVGAVTTLSVASGKFSDAAGNFNSDGADADNTIVFTSQDVTPPYLYFADSLDYKCVDVGNSITLNITLSESATDFDLSDINVIGGLLSNFVTVTPRNYRVTFTANDLTVDLATLSVAEGAFSDAAGNFNTYRSTGTTRYQKSISIINNHLAGSAGSENIAGSLRSDQITTFDGNDVVYAGEGSDAINGLPNSLNPDVYVGTLIAYGGGGNDFIFGKTGNDTLYGEEGNDVLKGGVGSDVLYGGNGNDVLSETDQLINYLYGEAGNDYLDGTGFLYGGSGNDQLSGGNISDHLEGGYGDDKIYGGDGVDTAFYEGVFSRYSVTVLYEGKEGAFSGYRVVDNVGSEGDDWINIDVEFLNFHNGKTIVTLNNGSISSITLNSIPAGSVSISGKIQQGEILTASNTLSDEDGIGTLKYQWASSNDGFNWTTLSTGTTLKLAEAQVGKFVRVTASYLDGIGTSESVTSSNSVAVINVNDSPTGSVVLEGTAKEGYILSATNTIADIDGLGLINYKWQSSIDGMRWTDVGYGATLQLDQTHVGQQIRAVGYYNDGHGTYETVPSSSTSAIAPLIRTYLNSISVIVAPGVLGKDAIFLKDLIEVMTYKSGGLLSQTIGYGGISYQYSQIDPLITVVTRNSDFTSEFNKEIYDYLKRDANISFAEAINLVGVQNIDSLLLKIAGADGNFVS